MASHNVLIPDLVVGADNPAGWVTTFQIIANQKFGQAIAVDGVYGPASGNVCKFIQALFGLSPATTTCGPQTWTVFLSA